MALSEHHEVNHWRIERSREGIWLVFGDGKYPHDPPRPASALEAALHVENARLRRLMTAAATLDPATCHRMIRAELGLNRDA